MCGIYAVVGKNAEKKVYNGLSKLEYRGYDSCGIGVKSDGKINLLKKVGYIENLKDIGELCSETKIAIGHTRWATHGGVSANNSHPHTDEKDSFAVVHNGIIENYKEFKNGVLKDHKFSSDTDTEVIPQLMSYYYNGNVWETFKYVISLLKGSYAIVLISIYDDNVYFARRGSPMVIAKYKSGDLCFSSDSLAFEDKTSVLCVPDNTLGYYDNNLYVYDTKHNIVEQSWSNMDSEGRDVSKGEYSHFMIKEIMEIPSVLRKCKVAFEGSEFVLPRLIDNIVFVSCGTSYHSSLIAKKYIEGISAIPVDCIIASEFIYSDYLVRPNTIAIFISQSGETADTLTALNRASSMGIFTLAITNVRGSTITRLADSVIHMDVGAEICVASTKAYTGQVLVSLLLSNVLLNNRNGNYESVNGLSFVTDVQTLDYIGVREVDYEKLLNIDINIIHDQVKTIVKDIKDSIKIHLIGKDYDYITSMEGSLKIKEVSYIFTDAYPCGELKHGTLSLIDNSSFVICTNTKDGIVMDKSKNAMHEISARGGKCIVISQYPHNNYPDAFKVISIPNVHHLLLPIVSIIPIDLIAFEISTSKGINPDKPRNLAKSVTVE